MSWRRNLGAASAALGMTIASLPLLGATAVATTTPRPVAAANPVLQEACGLDVTLVLDRSGSILDAGETGTVTDAAQEFVDGLEGTGGKVKIVNFGDTAQGDDDNGSSTSDLDDVAFRDPADVEVDVPSLGRSTNWDDALETVRRSEAIGGRAGGDLVVVLTDGNPTSRNNTVGTGNEPGDGHDSGYTTDGNGSAMSAAELDEAIREANALKAQGSHMFVVAVTDNVGVANIQAISGTAEFTGAEGTFGSSDYTRVSDFKNLVEQMRGLATELCQVKVDKTASPVSLPEPGGMVTYTVLVENAFPVPVTITDLVDHLGDENGPVIPGVDETSCAKLQLAASDATPGAGPDSTTCTFQIPTGVKKPGDTITDTVVVTVVGANDRTATGKDDATVTITNVPSSIDVTKVVTDGVIDGNDVVEPGGNVTYEVTVANTSTVDTVTIDTVTDDIHGGALADAGCLAVPFDLAPGASQVCSYTAAVNGAPNTSVTDTVTASGVDDDGAEVSDSDSATVDIVDGQGSLDVEKSVVDGAPVSEPGGLVRYRVDVTNTSTTNDTITLTSIADTIGGIAADFSGDGEDFSACDALVGTSLAPGASTSCEFVDFVGGQGGDTVTDVVMVDGVDEEQTPVSGSDSEDVKVNDVLPTATLTKTAGDTSVLSGTTVTYTVVIANTSVEDLFLTGLVDVVDGAEPVAIPLERCDITTIPVGGSATCEFDMVVTGSPGTSVTDVVTATLYDDEENELEPFDDETVAIERPFTPPPPPPTDVEPQIAVDKDNGGATLQAPGGEVDFDVTVTNEAAEQATITAIVDEIDGDVFDVTAVSGRVVETNCETGVVLGATGSPADTYTCTFTLSFDSDEAMSETDTVTVTVEDDDGDEDSDSDSATTVLTAVADLTIEKTSNALSAASGDGTYTLVVTNDGPSTATGVQVTDSLPPGITFASASGDGWTCAAAGQEVVCERESLASGASSTITMTVAVAASLAGETVTNLAEVDSDTADPDVGNNSDDDVVTLPAVLPDVVVRPQMPATPQATPSQPSVLGSQLPRTGSDAGPLAAVGAALLLAGAALVSSSRRRAG